MSREHRSGLGTLYGIGVGPGDPDLLTVKAVRLLERLDLVFVPRQVAGRSLARSIAAPYLDERRQEIVELDHCMRGSAAAAEAQWMANAAAIAERLTDGRDAAFLTEGDPLLFSTFLHIWSSLRRGHPEIPVEVVPGVTSILAAAAAAGQPLAQGTERVAIVPALSEPGDLDDLLNRFGSVVLLKAGRTARTVADRLRSVPNVKAVFVERVGLPGERVIRDLDQLAGRDNDYFSLLILRRTGDE